MIYIDTRNCIIYKYLYRRLFNGMFNYMEEIYKNYSKISNCSKDYSNINQLHHYYELEMKRFQKINLELDIRCPL